MSGAKATVKATTVEVRLPSRLGYEKVAMSTAAAVAKLMGFREDRVEDLKTAVAEACINAMEHGNRLNEGLSVGVVLSAGPGALEVKVIDDGKGATLAAASSLDEDVKGKLKTGANKDAAVEVGKLIAARALAAGVKEVIFDRGGYMFHGRVAALANAAREGGLSF